VEDIIEEKRKDGHKEYLVHWRGYPIEERT